MIATNFGHESSDSTTSLVTWTKMNA
jgi:hypothetical protein